MKILFVVPHPDDLEFACGSTVIELIKTGHEVHELCMTAGEYGVKIVELKGERISEIRRGETIRASQILGLKSLEFFGLIDGHVKLNKKNLDKLRNKIKILKPDVIFCADPLFTVDPHNDHVKSGLLTYFAVKSLEIKRPKLLLFYTYSPNYFFECRLLKISHLAFDAHLSQEFNKKTKKVFNKAFKLISGISMGRFRLLDTFRIVNFEGEVKTMNFKQKIIRIIFSNLFSSSLPKMEHYKPTPEQLGLKEFRF